ncbi:MAG: hypothetical protein ACREJ2_18520 [Planctomycetota bacterium]
MGAAIIAASTCSWVLAVLLAERSQAAPIDIRARLLDAARHEPRLDNLDVSDPGNRVKLVGFCYIGTLQSCDGPIYVVLRKSVITEMLEPRGIGSLLFFDRNFGYLGQYYSIGNPVGCIGAKLYLLGDSSATTRFGAQTGNVIDLSRGFENLSLIEEPDFAMYQEARPIS